MTPSTAWAVSRVLTGHASNGEAHDLPEPWRGRVEHLASIDPEDRPAAMDAMLAGQPDRDGFLEALASVDPTGPAPEAEPSEGGAPRPRYRLTHTANVESKPVNWLWRDRVPRGMLTLFAGDPKLGKSFVTLDVAAAVSRGAPLPGDGPPDGPGSVILLSAEDDVARTIVPRLKASGADLTRVCVLESVFTPNGNEALPNLRMDIDAIGAAVDSLGDCRLIVIDPVSAFLAGTDDHRNAELRGVLSPLKSLAERTNAAVILVSHMNKGGGTNGKHRVTGSIAYVGAARANFLFVRDRDDSRRTLMLANGCNLADDPPTLAYRIVDRGDGPAVEWSADPVSITADEALAAAAADPDEREERAACDEWLREVLANGSVPQREIVKAGRDAGFGERTLQRARQRIGARTQREGFGQGSKCHWSLGPAPPDPP